MKTYFLRGLQGGVLGYPLSWSKISIGRNLWSLLQREDVIYGMGGRMRTQNVFTYVHIFYVLIISLIISNAKTKFINIYKKWLVLTRSKKTMCRIPAKRKERYIGHIGHIGHIGVNVYLILGIGISCTKMASHGISCSKMVTGGISCGKNGIEFKKIIQSKNIFIYYIYIIIIY